MEMNSILDPNNKYTEMQRSYYENLAIPWNANSQVDPSGPPELLRSFHSQNMWSEYEHLFSHFDFDLSELVALDFGCGPGRNISLYGPRFKRIDGVDISSGLIENAKKWAAINGYVDSKFYVCNGVDLSCIPDSNYDIVFSTICLQHICVHEIRFNYLSEFFRILKPNGWITIQMGFNPMRMSTNFAYYYSNEWDAPNTNGHRDVEVQAWEQVKSDLENIGFSNCDFVLTSGKNIGHKQAIFFRAQKCL